MMIPGKHNYHFVITYWLFSERTGALSKNGGSYLKIPVSFFTVRGKL